MQKFSLTNKYIIGILGTQVLLFLFLFFVAGCTSDKMEAVDSKGALFQISVLSESGYYKLENKTLVGISNLTTLSGKYANFYIRPKTENNQITGASPLFKFSKNSDGIFIANNELSLAAASLYYQMQRLADIDAQVGEANTNSWPRNIGLITQTNDNMKNNAFYESSSDALYFVPYSRNDLPLYINSGVIAHEHFHSLFYKLSLKPACALTRLKCHSDLQSETQSVHYYALYHQDFLRSLNEGLADYWGWLYTQNPKFISLSLNEFSEIRNLETSKKPIQLDLQLKLFKYQLFSLDEKADYYNLAVSKLIYEHGNLIAQILKNFTEVYQGQRKLPLKVAQYQVAQVILKTIKLLGNHINELSNDQYYTGNDFIHDLYKQIQEPTESECLFLTQFISSEKITCKKSQ